MFNNKKSLLQKARIMMLAIVTILGIGGAFAKAPNNSADWHTYGVWQTNASSYEVTAITASTDYDCFNNPERVCTVRSQELPDPMTGEIPISGSVELQDGDFNK